MTYLDHHAAVEGREGVDARAITHSWVEFTRARLAWLYGEARAGAIIAGEDPATNADLASWSVVVAMGRAA